MVEGELLLVLLRVTTPFGDCTAHDIQYCIMLAQWTLRFPHWVKPFLRASSIVEHVDVAEGRVRLLIRPLWRVQ